MYFRRFLTLLLFFLSCVALSHPNPAIVDEGVDQTLPTDPKPEERERQHRTPAANGP